MKCNSTGDGPAHTRRSHPTLSPTLQHNLNPNYVSDCWNRLKKRLNGYLILVMKRERRSSTLKTRGMAGIMIIIIRAAPCF